MTDSIKIILPVFIAVLFVFSCTSDPAPSSEGYTTVSPPEIEKKTNTTTKAEEVNSEGNTTEKSSEEVKEEKPEKEKVEEKKEEKPKPKPKPKKRPKVSFESTSFDYGVIMQGDKVEHKFKFTNKGKADLVITGVSASCGCTQPSYPFVPIKPGEEGEIGVVYDSKGKLGRQNPTITVVTNARPSTYKLKLQGFVDAERAKEQPKAPETESAPIAPEAGETPENPVEGGGMF